MNECACNKGCERGGGGETGSFGVCTLGFIWIMESRHRQALEEVSLDSKIV